MLLYFFNNFNFILWSFSWSNFSWLLLFTLLLFANNFLFSSNWFLKWRFSFLEWWFSNNFFCWLNFLFRLAFRLAFLNYFFSFNNWFNSWRFNNLFGWLYFFLFALFAWLLNLFSNWFSSSFGGDNFFWSLNCLLLLRALFTLLLNFLFSNNSFLNWRFSFNNFFGDFLFTFFWWWFLLFSFFSILSFNSFNWLFLNFLGLFIHRSFRGLSSWLSGFWFSDWGLFFFTRFLWLRFLFGLFFGINLFFLWNDQRKWAWWIFFWILR